MVGVRKRVIASLPGVRWRDARIAKIESDLEAERVKLNQANERLKITEGQLQDAKAKVDEAQNLAERVEKRRKRDATEAFRRRSTVSFKAQLVSYKAAYDASPGVTDPLYSTKCQVPYKLRNYSFAESHGFNAPQVYRVWESASSVDLSQVQADQMVLKADSGHSGKAVWPLIREGEVWRSLDGKLSIPNAPLPAEMCAELAEMRGPFFAEELLKSLGGAPVPEDVKLYMAYGEVMHVLVMEPPADGSLDRRAFQRRYFAEDGMDLGRLVSGAEYGDINPPAGLSELVKAAKVLSVASGLPFIRVDLYQTVGGPVLGELTLVPGGRQAYSRQHDEHLGSMWAGAQARLDRDLLMGRPPGMLFGSEDFAWHYPGDSVGGGPNDWPIMRARKKHESRPTLV